MSRTSSSVVEIPLVEGGSVRLKEPALAAVLAWLVPGSGHLYQGRTAKGLLFMVCILGIFVYGLALGEGRVVYAAWSQQERRLHYLCQAGVGIAALPALVQAYRVRSDREPLGKLMAPPANARERHELHRNLHRYFELGTVYTMVAGLLNLLVVYDAWGGPVQMVEEHRDDQDDESEEKS